MKTKQVVAILVSLISIAVNVRADTIEYSKAEKSATTVASAQVPQISNWPDVLGGRVVPLSVTMGNLDSTWRTFHLEDTVTNLLRSSYSYNFNFDSFGLYYTSGATLSINNETYLVTYRLKRPVADLVTGNLRQEDIFKAMVLTPNTRLVLSLLNLSTANNFYEVAPFDAESFARAATNSKNRVLLSQSMSNLKQLGIAVIQYSQEQDEVYPPMQTMYQLKKAIYPFLRSDTVFVQPINKKFYVPNAALSKKSLASINQPSMTAMIYEADFDSDGKRAVGFADGHVKRVTPVEWTKIKKDSNIQ